jgi:hypothetical protein
MNKGDLKILIESEGDYFEWINTLNCFIRRNSMGAWCGYTIIPKSFPLDFEQEINLDCHGGITYQSINIDGDLVVGFDCAHSGDLVPKLGVPLFKMDTIDFSIYRDKQYVIDEVNHMVEQILKIVQVNRYLRINEILNN